MRINFPASFEKRAYWLEIISPLVDRIAALSRWTVRPEQLIRMRRQRSRHDQVIGFCSGNPRSVIRLRNARWAERARGPG